MDKLCVDQSAASKGVVMCKREEKEQCSGSKVTVSKREECSSSTSKCSTSKEVVCKKEKSVRRRDKRQEALRDVLEEMNVSGARKKEEVKKKQKKQRSVGKREQRKVEEAREQEALSKELEKLKVSEANKEEKKAPRCYAAGQFEEEMAELYGSEWEDIVGPTYDEDEEERNGCVEWDVAEWEDRRRY